MVLLCVGRGNEPILRSLGCVPSRGGPGGQRDTRPQGSSRRVWSSRLPEFASRFREPELLYRPLVPSEVVQCALGRDQGDEEKPVLGALLEVLEGFAS